MKLILRKAVVYPALNTFLAIWSRWKAPTYDLKKTIVLASSPRGGSSWLSDLIGTLPGYPVVWEPLHLGHNPEIESHGFDWQTYMRAGQDDETKLNYLKAILTGKNLNHRIVSLFSFHPTQFCRFRGYIVKFTNANLLLTWLLKKYPLKAILMLRHPCAVVSSQLRLKGWDNVNKDTMTFHQSIAKDYPHLAELRKKIRTREEVLAFEWALQTYIPLHQTKPHPWCLTSYERLVTNGPEELRRLFQYLDQPIPPKVLKQLSVPARTTSKTSDVRKKGADLLAGWKKHLNAEQIREILDVTHQAGLDFYTEDSEPDYQKLNSLTAA